MISRSIMIDRFAELRYDRLADTMGWDVPSESGGYYQVAARRLLKHGYR